jgi:hypothetical protein
MHHLIPMASVLSDLGYRIPHKANLQNLNVTAALDYPHKMCPAYHLRRSSSIRDAPPILGVAIPVLELLGIAALGMKHAVDRFEHCATKLSVYVRV